MSPPITVRDALGLVLRSAQPLPAEDVRLELAGGRVVCEPVRAAIDLPPFRSSAMDGFAVRAGDVPGTLRVTERSAAGSPARGTVGAGETIAVTTGGVVPDGADAVVPVEATVDGGDEVEFTSAIAAGANVRPQGGDLAAGAVVVAAGYPLGPAQLAALAATGVTHVRCARRPRVTIVTTGTELRPAGTALAPGQIYESNGLMLEELFTRAGLPVERLASVGDDPDEHREALAAALETDVLVTSGGVSVGPLDLVRATLAELGVTETFWGVAMRPGKPLAFGRRGRTLVFGLPGNPVSALVGAHLFVLPALRALQGHHAPAPSFTTVSASEGFVRHPAREDYPRAVLTAAEGGWPVASTLRGQESHMIAAAAGADAIVRVEVGEGPIEPGTLLQALII